ncbi:MAG: hypothetical protein K1X75_02325 [Leptospirales bacterium]|nr:hypothetical protein [Leptospirales bacterium]
MAIHLQIEEDRLLIRADTTRMDGENLIFTAMEKAGVFEKHWREVTIDLQHLEYLNSLGITELVNIHRSLRGNGRTFVLRLIHVDRKVNAILELVEIQKIAEISLKGA